MSFRILRQFKENIFEKNDGSFIGCENSGVFAGKQAHTNTYEERVKEGVREIAYLRKGCVTKITFIYIFK